MNLIQRDDWLTRLVKFLPELRPRPNTGRLWLDIVFVLFMVTLQVFILPLFLGKYLYLDIVTPWLAISFVRQKPINANILALVAACALEGHSSTPSWLYICSYWIMSNVIMNVRGNLSWRHRVPWMVTFALSQFWIIMFESLVISFQMGIDYLGFKYWGLQIPRLAFAVGLGMYLSREWLDFNAEEPVPQ